MPPFLFFRTRAFLLIITLLLAALIMTRISHLFLLWKASAHDPPAELNINPVKTLDKTLLNHLLLFGKSEAVSPYIVREIIPDDDTLYKAPLSKGKAKLTGVLGGVKGVAIINNGGKQSSHYPGETIDQDLKIVKIFSDRIIIINNNRYEALILD